jgi:uncharacterized protein YgiM (DUF1202 family)
MSPRSRLSPVIAWLVAAGLLGGSLVLTTLPATAATTSLPSVFCDFEEPLQWVVLSPEGVLVEDHYNGAVFNRYKATNVRGSINNRLTVSLPQSSGNSAIVLEKVDGEYFSHSVTFNDREGTCDRFPTGFLLRKVVGVADDDELNIRSAPNASADIVSTSANGRLIWVKPTKAKWFQVAYAETNEDGGTEGIFTGWARATFVTKVVPRIAHDDVE